MLWVQIDESVEIDLKCMLVVIYNTIKMQYLHLINRHGEKTQDIGQVREKCQKKSEYLAMCKSANFNMNHFLIVAFTMAGTVNFRHFMTQMKQKQRMFSDEDNPIGTRSMVEN